MNAYQHLLNQLQIAYAHPGGKDTTEIWMDKLDLSKMEQILEVGCGAGHTIRQLRSKTPATIYGIDVSPPEMIAVAKKQTDDLRDIKINQADIRSLPYKPESFDLIIAESVLTFTPVNESLQEITRLLKPNGYLVLLEMTRIEILLSKDQQQIKDFYLLPNLYSLTEWKNILLAHQYNYVEFQQVGKQSNSIQMEHPIDEVMLATLYEHYYLNELYQDQLLAYLFIAKKVGDE
ncbi:methyltransferase YodH [Gracilibacillus boraciitolerans JCM 21714]|uniref:Methyltransferase YodH n=1 Tax=Gracilibacillus boraciitolerans JCM 21714 TaxID=1298598 RepID=W4VG21_9BACI|nr:class I SAM-dependent methyltransferase [Gracilibacillus boraciitolerans]GAE92106.1 methyltransferase YodH [Gracilibacillus boraciitolerans JCM 21714]